MRALSATAGQPCHPNFTNMSTEIKVPSVGESISSGLLSVWHKQDGDAVGTGDLLFTLETDKVSTEVTAQEDGVLKIAVAEGEEVKVGQVVGTIEPGETGGGENAEATKQAEKPRSESKTREARKVPVKKKSKSSDDQAAEETSSPSEDEGKTESAPPDTPKPKIAPPDDPRVRRRKLSPLRRKIAMQLVAAQQKAAILTTFNECDMSAVMRLRKEMQEDFQRKHGVKLGFMSFFIKAVVDALRAVPAINSRIDGDDLVIQEYFDIGVAVGTERGLIVPVLRDCEGKTFAEIETDLAEYATKAREGRIGLDDLRGGVFTISNGGVYGSLLSTPILNPPQSGILGMHKIQERPVAVQGQVVVRPMMYLALSYDHRVVDGKEAVTFLVRVKDCIENPVRLLVGA